jgi:hypothetical protein
VGFDPEVSIGSRRRQPVFRNSAARPHRQVPLECTTAYTKVGLFAAWDGPSTAAALQAATASEASPWGRHADFWLSWRAREAGFRWGDSRVKHYYRIPQGDPNELLNEPVHVVPVPSGSARFSIRWTVPSLILRVPRLSRIS